MLRMRTLPVALVAGLLALGLLTACGGKLRPRSPLDTPESHYQAGLRLLEAKDLDGARAEFQYAIGLNKKYAPGYEGLGQVELARANPKEAEKYFKQSLARDQGWAPAHVGLGRAYALQGDSRRAVQSFEAGIRANPRYAPGYLWLGRHYVDQRDFPGAREAFRRGVSALATNTELNEGWQWVSEVERATTGVPPEVVEIALSPALTRAELAVLISTNQRLMSVFERRRAPEQRGFVTPQQERPGPPRQTQASDLPAGYWAKAHIDRVVAAGAMDLFPDGGFDPEHKVTRQELAQLVERVLAVAWNDEGLKTRFFGSTSPFADVPNTHFAFNAVVLATSRGVMKGRPDGTFGLEDTLPGYEAVTIIVHNLTGVLQP
jgi:tetratricopeptide (TPR) repeat protein